ncbi:DNA-binding protein [Elizabethkingia anophelis]|nr:DNA-binding protein [Elizabethkingia anophelis]HCD9235796.1 KilA-N domain-containing protein [Elizabethkingia anophelis]HCZ8396920.1 KilA-N domain-containing protein [Elizabethkingia anophelis]
MAKPFGNEKRPQFWINNQYTSDFLKAISKARNIALADLVKVTKGGNNSGTWMHEDVAIEFARWLNPAFAIWCNSQINQSSIKAGIPVTLYFK